jgi:hypothetical protein
MDPEIGGSLGSGHVARHDSQPDESRLRGAHPRGAGLIAYRGIRSLAGPGRLGPIGRTLSRYHAQSLPTARWSRATLEVIRTRSAVLSPLGGCGR